MQHDGIHPETYLRFAGDCLRKASLENDPAKRRLRIVIAVVCAKLAERAKVENG